MKLRKTHAQFVEQANKIHKNKFTYPETYVGDTVKINIICPIHGSFQQVPSSHLQGCGCRQCAIDYRASLFVKNNDAFVIKARQIHNNKYEYIGEYKGAHIKLNIVCSIHGVFQQIPTHHLSGNGCPQCAGRTKKTKTQFVEEANIVHNGKYKYPSEYINAATHMEIECPKHGIFRQVPDTHLNGCGCPVCASNTSKMETAWLDSLGIPGDAKHRQQRIKIGNSYIKPDGFDPDTKTIYEFYGDYFHGNPRVYDPMMINHKNGKTLGELYQKTLAREQLIIQAGYKIISIWELDWNNR